jgi:hypothetical protein
MKTSLLISLLVISCNLFAQAKDTLPLEHRASFEITFDQNLIGKEGYHLNGYIVIISDKNAKKLHGKKIRITGIVTTKKGLKHQPKKYDENGNEIILSGREEDAEFILSPKIQVIN